MNVAFIPVRGGSKSIPMKNIKLLNGKPLVYWTVTAACNCQYIDKVYVATDSDIIRKTIEAFVMEEVEKYSKLQVIGRSLESATETASTEFAMLEFAEKYEFDAIALVQATSPMLTSDDLDKGFCAFADKDTDSILSVVRQKPFIWREDECGFVHPINYDIFNRPRRQEFVGHLIENGAFFITSREQLLKSKSRISGRIRAVEMPADAFYEIDDPHDWVIVESLMKKRYQNSVKEKE